MRIAIGADHAGYELKERLKKFLEKQGHQLQDEGTVSNDSVDYPDYAAKVAHKVSGHQADVGLLVCGSGIGMAISANKVAGIRATTATSELEAQLSREHNDANVLAIGARLLKEDVAINIVQKFLTTAFAHGRHENRIKKISELEKKEAQPQHSH
jgi:ribose 5-phosphate isomerase B